MASLDNSSIANYTDSKLKTLEVQKWSPSEMFLLFIFGSIMFATICGNLLVLYLFVKSKRGLRSPTHWFIANLAVADFCVGAIVMPILITVTFSDFKWHWGNLACSTNEYFHFWLCATSLLSMMSIAVERYIGVRFPLRHKRILTKRRIINLMVLTWVLGLISTALPLSVWPVTTERIPGFCPVNLRPQFVLFLSLSVFFLPALIMSVMYWLTYRNAVKLYVPNGFSPNSQFSSSAPSSVVQPDGKLISPSSGNGNQTETEKEIYLDRKSKQAYLAKKLGIVVGIMLTLYAPLFVVFLIVGFDGSLITNRILLAVGWLRYFCSCVNPFLYMFVVPGYKQHFFKIIWNEKSSLESSSESNSSSGVKRESKKSVSGSEESRSNCGGFSRSESNNSGYPSTSETEMGSGSIERFRSLMDEEDNSGRTWSILSEPVHHQFTTFSVEVK